MKIVVLVKEVPDTHGDRRLSMQTGLADRAVSETVLDESGERAVEVALSYLDRVPGTGVVVLSMAPAGAVANVRKALAMGAESAVHVVDEKLLGADLGLTAEVLAAALERIGFDLVIAGDRSTDGAAGMLPAMLAERLAVAGVTGLSAVELTEGTVKGTRKTDDVTMTVSADLPAVISVTEALPDARFPNFKGIMAAKKKPYETLALDDLGIEPMDPDKPRSIMTMVSERPPRAAGVRIADSGDAGELLADFLIQNRLT